MERQFTIKDFFVFLMLAGLLVSVWFTMLQRDIHWEELQDQRTSVQAMREDIANIRSDVRRLREGGFSAQGTGPNGGQETDESYRETFEHLLALKENPDYAPGDWFVESIRSRIENLTPMRSSSAYASRVQGWVLEGLIYRDAHDPKNWVPKLARALPTRDMIDIHVAEWEEQETDAEGELITNEDGSPKMMPKTEVWAKGDERPAGVPEDATVEERNVPRFTFKMRKGVTFSDGTPVTAHDVKFSFDFIMNPLIIAHRERAYYARIWKVEAPDDETVVFTFKERYFNAMSLCGQIEVLAKHVYEKYLSSPDMATQYNQEETGMLFGSGPYKLADLGSWTPDQPVELVRNDRYWGERPPLDKLVWKVIKLQAADLASYRNGDIDLYGSMASEFKELQADEQMQGKSKSFEYLSPVAGYLYIAWNQREDGDPNKPTWFADKKVRQAMTYLTDRDRICKEIYRGYALPADGPFHPAGEQDSPNVKRRSFNLEKAKQLLAEAGFEDTDGDGVLEKDGKPFEFKLIYPSGSPEYKKTILFLKDSYALAGVRLIDEPLEFNVMLDRIDKRQFEAMSLGWTSSFEIDIYQMFHSDQIKEEGDNYMSYRSDALDRAIVQARTEMDESKRMELWHRCHEIMWEDQPYTFLFRRKTLVFLDKRFHNAKVLEPGYLNLSRGDFPMEWYVPASEQRYTD